MKIYDVMCYENVNKTYHVVLDGISITTVTCMTNSNGELEMFDIDSGFLIDEVYSLHTILNMKFLEVCEDE